MAALNKADLKSCVNCKDGHLEESLMNFFFHVNIQIDNTEPKGDRRHLSCKFTPSWHSSKCHTWKWISKHPEIYSFVCLSSKSFDWNARCTLILYIIFLQTYLYEMLIDCICTAQCTTKAKIFQIWIAGIVISAKCFLDFNNNNNHYSSQNFNAQNRALAICYPMKWQAI